jgi:tRNA (mo5U34)-methyltransferase
MSVTADAETLTPEALEAKVRELGPWFHNLTLRGVKTAPDHFLGDYPSFKFANFAHVIPQDLTGKTVLDIGCNAGFYSFELARRGARVTGIDHDPHYLRQASWAAGQFGLAGRVRFRQMQVYDLARVEERWDLILFMGVFYHLRYPLLALDLVVRRLKRLMVFQTLTMPGEEVVEPAPDSPIHERDAMLEPGWPKMAFIEHRLAGDPTNWWAPNHAGVEAMLRSAGVEILARPGHEIYLCRPAALPSRDRDWMEEELRAAAGLAVPGGASEGAS